jgi:cytoskeletal protein RodZ
MGFSPASYPALELLAVAPPRRMSYHVLGRKTVGDFGNKFRKAREKKDLSLEDVSNVTKIGSRMLQAIEEERFDQLPGGVFNKGFIRAYAKHLGLNDEEAVTDYLACLRQAQIDAHEVWQPAQPAAPRPAVPEKPRPSRPSQSQPTPPAAKSPAPVEELPELQLPRAEDIRPRRNNFVRDSSFGFPWDVPWGILAAAVVVVILAVILWTRHSHKINTAAASTSPVQTAQATPPVPVSMPNPARSSAPNSPPPSATHPAATAKAPVAAAALNAGMNNTNPKQTNTSDTNNQINGGVNNDKNDVTVRSFAKPNPKSSETATAPLTLVIRADETSWISVLADGQPVSQETLIAPAHTSVRASREIVARIGNAAGVTFLWNGQEIPANGAEAEVKTFVFDSTGMRTIASTPAPAQ